MSSNTTNSPLDIVGLPDDITRRIQVFHTHPICDDKYFYYCKKRRLFWTMSGDFTDSPYTLLDMYACHLAGNFRFSIKYSRYEGFKGDNLASRLEADDGELSWGNGMYGWQTVCNDADYSAQFLTNSGNTFWHKFITKYMWLNQYVRESRDYGMSRYLKNTVNSGPKEKVFTPNKTMTKKELITLLDNNGIYFSKSWNKSKLINAWYKSTN